MSELYPLPTNSMAYDTDDIQQQKINNSIQAILNGATLKELQGIPDHVMDTLYAHAYNFYQKGMLDEALIFFKFLCSYDCFNTNYFLGLGAVHQQKKNYAEAVAMYHLAFLIDEHNYPAMFYSGQCHLMLKNKEQALQCFTTVSESNGAEQLQKQARAYLAVLQPVQKEGVIHA